MPCGKTFKLGAWEDQKFIGVVIFSYGANNHAAKSFKLRQSEVCELTRVALSKHKNAVSKILAISIKMLKKNNPKLKVLFSYSDITNQNHHGGIYQATNFIYQGVRKTSDKGAYYIINGKKMHGRSARAKFGSEKSFPKGWSHSPSEAKHLYVMALDKSYKFEKQSLKYPKCVTSKENVASEFHSEETGVNPSVALQLGKKAELING